MSDLYAVEVRHLRAAPVRHAVRHKGYLWYGNVEDARFDARDHLGDPSGSIRANVEAFLAEHGVEIDGGPITMLANARHAGYVFNPLTLYWCHDPGGALAAVVAEVHNTYGQRHAYLLRPEQTVVAKQFYVSPFYPVDGHYRMSVPEPGERLAITITLHRPGDRKFTATVRGVRRPATAARRLAAAVDGWLVRSLITGHGIALYRKGLPVIPRPGKENVASRLAALVHDVTGAQAPVRLRAWDGSEAGPHDGPTLVIGSRRALRRLLWTGSLELGVARGYVTGELDVDGDLADGLQRAWAFARDRPAPVRLTRRARIRAAITATRLAAFGPPPAPPASEARLGGALHSRGRDRAAIAHHYDLSNDFYRLLLDDTMAYSCAYFTNATQTLADAQHAKLDLICQKLQLSKGMRLLDVGCGWGSLILHAAEHYGVHATGITLSRQQHDLVAKRIAERDLTGRVTARVQDYRELSGRFDAVASIEMGEHVGEQQYPRYTAMLLERLVPGGRLLLQQMSRAAGTAPGGGPFIERYIAPDMHMRPLPTTLAYLQDAGLEIVAVDGMREHYVRTVQAWTETFEARYADAVALVGEQRARVWRLYLVGGACSFAEGRMGVDQILAVRPQA